VSTLLAMGSAGYSAGTLVGGPISDLLGGKGTLASMLAIMGVAKLVMARSSRLSLMTVAWVGARVAHALTWPGVMLMIRPWFLGACFPLEDCILCARQRTGPGIQFIIARGSQCLTGKTRTTALSILTTSSRVGAFLGSLLGGMLLARATGWRGLSRSTGIVTLVVAAMQLTMRSGPRSKAAALLEAAPAAGMQGDAKTEEATSAGGSTLSIVLRETKLFCVFGSTALVTPTFDLTTLLPMCALSHLMQRTWRSSALSCASSVSLFCACKSLSNCRSCRDNILVCG
jgi:sugar phosphate permease